MIKTLKIKAGGRGDSVKTEVKKLANLVVNGIQQFRWQIVDKNVLQDQKFHGLEISFINGINPRELVCHVIIWHFI